MITESNLTGNSIDQAVTFESMGFFSNTKLFISSTFTHTALFHYTIQEDLSANSEMLSSSKSRVWLLHACVVLYNMVLTF